jgi:Icc-related predicted phosphoesterase
MLAFLGDIHGDHEAFQAVLDEVVKFEFTALIQVGDFGWYKNTIPHFRAMKFPIPVYFIDGNHEEFPLLRGITDVTEMSENLFFVPRGTVLMLDDRKVAFMGGAASVDKDIRLSLGASWYDDENIRNEEIRRLDGVEGVDILVTHAPPQSIVQKHFDPRNLL